MGSGIAAAEKKGHWEEGTSEEAVERVGMSEFDGLTREELLGMVLDLRQSVDVLTERVCALEAENEELRSRLGGGGKVIPSWVKANKPARIEKERKRRHKAFVRRRETPTEVVEHALERCPDCGRPLSGGTEHHARQVIEIPVAPVRVIEHRMTARYCGVCRKRYIGLSSRTLGGRYHNPPRRGGAA